jgi:DNA-binding LacI/PurR family transcriptional regulator
VIAEEMFYAQLFHLLQVRLQAAGATPRLFIVDDNPPDRGVGFRHLPGLPEACAGGQLDGFITSLRIDAEDWQGWHARGLEMVHVGAWEAAPAGVVIEQGRMVTEAVGLLRERGCNRLAVVGPGPHQPGFDHYWHAFRQVCGEAGMDDGFARELHGGLGPAGGWRVADQLLNMPERERPDGLIVMDDRIATGLTAVLAPACAAYCPQIVVQTNLQAPLAFALPALHYEVDVEKLARCAVDMLMARLRNPQTEPRREWLHPERHSDEPVYMIRNKAMDVAHNKKEVCA